jgi:hypothetical protein
MVAVDQASETLLDYVEEGGERSKGRVFSIGTENWNKIVIRRVSSGLSGRICGVIRRVPLELDV